MSNSAKSAIEVGLDPQRNRLTAGRRDTPRPWPAVSGEYSSRRRGQSPLDPRTRTTYRPHRAPPHLAVEGTPSTEVPSTGRPCSSCPPCKLSPTTATGDRSGWWPLGDSTSVRSLSGLADPLYVRLPHLPCQMTAGSACPMTDCVAYISRLTLLGHMKNLKGSIFLFDVQCKAWLPCDSNDHSFHRSLFAHSNNTVSFTIYKGM